MKYFYLFFITTVLMTISLTGCELYNQDVDPFELLPEDLERNYTITNLSVPDTMVDEQEYQVTFSITNNGDEPNDTNLEVWIFSDVTCDSFSPPMLQRYRDISIIAPGATIDYTRTIVAKKQLSDYGTRYIWAAVYFGEDDPDNSYSDCVTTEIVAP